MDGTEPTADVHEDVFARRYQRLAAWRVANFRSMVPNGRTDEDYQGNPMLLMDDVADILILALHASEKLGARLNLDEAVRVARALYERERRGLLGSSAEARSLVPPVSRS
jgi:hypothetical protein